MNLLPAQLLVASYVAKNDLAKLAPLVERLADWLDRTKGAGVAGAAPIPPAQPPPGWVRLQLAARKVLAFDYGVRAWLLSAALITLGGAAAVMKGLSEFLDSNGRAPWTLLISLFGLFITGVVIAWGAFSMAERMCTLRRIVERSVVVPGRLVSASQGAGNSLHPFLALTVAYWYAGRAYQTIVAIKNCDPSLVGPTPELLVDTESPGTVLIRHLYT